MEIPSKIREPKSTNPNVMLIYAIPKAGKTTIASQLEDSLLIELEPGGADYVSGRVLELNAPKEFNEFLKTAEEHEGKLCTYLIIDSGTKLDEWSEIVGTYAYMSKSQGKKFNREGNVDGGKMIMHTDSRFETVHELPNGNGYQHSRGIMTDWYDRLVNLITTSKINHLIIICHVKDKLIETKRGDIVDAIDINLTGKVKSIYASRVDAIGFFYRSGKQGIINFNNEYKVICGGRCNHLDGEIIISEKQEDNTIKTFWDKIYLKTT